MEKFCDFCGLIGDRETFPAKLFHSWNITVDRTLQEENKTVNALYRWLFRTPLPLIRFHVSMHAVSTPCIGIAVTVAQATLCDFQLDIILQPHCLAISAKVRKRQVKR